MTLSMLCVTAAPPTVGMVVFGVLWLRELRARQAAEAERDRLWDQTRSVT